VYSYILGKSLVGNNWCIQIINNNSSQVIFELDSFFSQVEAIAFAEGYLRGLETAKGLL